MQARSKPKSSAAAAGGGGPLFGEPEKPKQPPADAIVVRDAFQAQYKRKYGVLADWGGAEARETAHVMRKVREAVEQRKGVSADAALAKVISMYLADDEKFLVGNSHKFMLLRRSLPAILSKALSLGQAKSGPQIRTGSW
jgi:hypothetical protein